MTSLADQLREVLSALSKSVLLAPSRELVDSIKALLPSMIQRAGELEADREHLAAALACSQEYAKLPLHGLIVELKAENDRLRSTPQQESVSEDELIELLVDEHHIVTSWLVKDLVAVLSNAGYSIRKGERG